MAKKDIKSFFDVPLTGQDSSFYEPAVMKGGAAIALWKAVASGVGDTRRCLVDDFGLQMKTEAVDCIAPLLVAGDLQSLRKAALFAILLISHCQLAECILIYITEELLCPEDGGCDDEEDFPTHVTPLILACILNQHDTVRMLMNRGHTVHILHRASCKCAQCSEDRCDGESVETCVRRIDAYRAMSSSAFLWHASRDPLRSAFQLAGDLDECAVEEPEQRESYAALGQCVRRFAATVAETCRTQEELSLLLERTEGAPFSTGTEGFTQLPRFRSALDADSKDFLCGVNVQALLKQRWLGGWASRTTSSAYNWFVRYPVHTILFPITAPLFVLSGGFLFKSYRYPKARFISFSASYFLFIVLVLCMTQLHALRATPDVRGHPENPIRHGIHWILWLYVFGMVLFDFCTFCRLGFKRYFSTWWHLFDYVMIGLYVVGFLCWIRSVMVTNDDQLNHFHRKHWYPFDPYLVYEWCFACASIITFWRSFYFLQITRMIGPTVVTIGRGVADVMVFTAVMVLVLLSFGVGINFLYENYNGGWIMDTKGNRIETPMRFDHFKHTLSSLYWGIYGYLPPSTSEIHVGNIGNDREIAEHLLPRYCGELLKAVYYVINVIVLLNLLIALILSTSDPSKRNQDQEWKMVRCHIWAEFFEESNCVPPPFNILYLFVSVVRDFFKGAKLGFPDVLYKPIEATSAELQEYQELMIILYFRYRQGKGDKYRSASAFKVEGTVR